MDGQTYRDTVRRARAHIEHGTAEDLMKAEEELASLRRTFPKRLEYICAVVALMIARGEDGVKCRNVLDYTAQEYYPFQALADVFELKSRTFPEGSLAWRQTRFSHTFYQNGSLPQEYFARLHALRANFLAKPSDTDLLRALAEEYYVTRNMLAYFVLMMAYCKRTGREDYDDILVEDTGIPYPEPIYHGNFGFLLRMFTDGQRNLFVLIGAPEDDSDQQVLAHALEMLGQQPMLLRETWAAEMEQDMNAYALRCIQEARTEQGHIVLNVGAYRHTDGRDERATSAVVRLLGKTQETPLIVFARDDRMGELHRADALGKDVQRLSYCLPPQFSYALAFAWAGDYLKYISYFYGENMEPLLDAPAACDFSIVIPVRNAVDTLQSTVETCLALDYDGSYEIVISDNSDEGRHEIRHFVEALNDPRIRYYHTPFLLEIDKSFEYAYLHARGVFIFSLGADDGVLPWALKYIKQAMEDYPSASIFSWHREFYTWPGFMPEGQDFQLVQLYDPEASEHYLAYPLRGDHANIIRNIRGALYRIPLFYINGGFRRGYLREVLQRTERLVEGRSQDIYMGAVNLFLQEECIELQCPLTIAGMSGHSLGGGARRFPFDIAQIPPALQHIPLHKRQGEYIPRGGEMAIPYILTADIFIFYMSLCRLQDYGFSMDFRPEQSYTALSDHILHEDLRFERFWGLLLYGSTLCGGSVHDQCLSFYEKICDRPTEIAAPHIIPSHNRKGYVREGNELRLNPLDFGCRNVADVARLEARIQNL